MEDRIEKVLREIGIKKDQTVLDFGCGSGNYTIPTAKIVGKKGVVYALDQDKSKLNELTERADRAGLKNIETIETTGEIKIGLDSESVDVVLLYDIFWYFPLTDPRLPKLLNEVYRLSRPHALISVYPKHIDSNCLKEEIESVGFYLKDRYSGMLIHEGRLEKGQILNFKKT